MPKMTQSVADQAAAIAQNHRRQIAAIVDDPRLTPEYKRTAAARIHVEQKRQMDELQSRFSDGAAAAATNHSRKLFGQASVTGADAISVRDASDRAEQLADPSQALNLYERARNNGDDHLARAIVQKAYESSHSAVFGSGWDDVLEAHAQATPGFAERLNEMAEASSMSDNFANAAHFMLFKPAILDGFSDYRLNEMAQAAD